MTEVGGTLNPESRGQTPDAGSLWVIAAIYLLFGTIAYVARDFNSHFLLFIVTGLLVGVLAFLCRCERR